MKRYALCLMLVGVIGGIFIWSCLGCVALIRKAFDAGSFMGWSTITCIGLLLSSFMYVCFAELSGYFSIRRV